MFKKLVRSISIGVIIAFAVTALPLPAFAAGTPHTSYGIVLGGQTTDNWTLYVVARPTETLTGTISESGGNYFYQAQVGNLTTAWNDGDDSLVFVARETNPGANNHTGYYTVMNEDLDVTTNPQPYEDCTVRQIPTPTAAQGSTGIDLSWSAAATDTSETPQGNNIAGYNVYRSTSQFSGFTQINSSTITGTTYTDTTGTTGTTYYYAIELVFRGGAALGIYSANSNGVEFPIITTPLNITTTSLPDGTVGTAYNQAVAAENGTTPYTWSIISGALPDGLALNATSGVISGTPTVANPFNFTVQVEDAALDTDTQALSITITDVLGPDITDGGISPATAEVGQTLLISGSNFGATEGEVWFGGVQGVPTLWQDDNIIIAVPSGVDTGTVVVRVETATENDTENIEIAGEKIYIEDFEGGAVNCFLPSADSLYYVFANSDDIDPNNADINAELRQAEAAYDSATGAKVRYSYDGNDGTDWGGGWGAKLANTLDLDSADEISIFSKWDGTANQVKLNLKDSDGTAVAATIDNAILANLDIYGEVTLTKSSFSVDDDGSDSGHDGSFSWSDVTGYNFVYDGTETTAEYHYLDTITANITQAPTGEGIYSIEPASGPAGTKVTVTGNGFGDTQGQSMLVFDNGQSGVSYQAREVLSWSNTQIVAIVPRLASVGDYKVKVIKITIIQETGSTQAWQSNEEDFRVTASAANEGGIATIYPNPFNPLAETINATGTGADANRDTIAFNAGSSTTVGIYIYDMTARLVQQRTVTMGTPDSTVQALGWDGTQASWNGHDTYGNLAGDGVYIMKIIDQDSKRVIAKGKILVIKQ